MAAEKKEDVFTVKGEELLARVKELIREGNARKITIKDREGKTLMVVPLTVGVVGVLIAPVLAALGALAAMITECTIVIERD